MSDNDSPVVLVTGGASGIGAVVAEHWIAAGGRVGVIDVAKIAEPGPALVGEVADVQDAEQVRAAVASIVAETGRLDAVVNCAGIAQKISAAEGADDDWGRLLDIHLNGTMRVCRAAYPFLRDSARAAIVNISSVAASAGLPGRSNYAAAKSGIEGLTRVLAVEWGPDIRVNAVAPGYVNTPMMVRLLADGQVDPRPVVTRTPLGRFADPGEIAAVVCFLASPAASFVTGQSLRVDGGLTIEGNWYPRPN